jgi:hypothetical protein
MIKGKGVKRRIIRSDGRVQNYRIHNLKRFNKKYIKTKKGFKNLNAPARESFPLPHYNKDRYYRTTFTSVYPPKDQKNKPCEVRVWIYTDKPVTTEEQAIDARDDLTESDVVNTLPFYPDIVIGLELNEPVERANDPIDEWQGIVSFTSPTSKRTVWSVRAHRPGSRWVQK